MRGRSASVQTVQWSACNKCFFFKITYKNKRLDVVGFIFIMELTLFVITFLWSLKMSSAIRCYSCEVEHTQAYNQAAKKYQSTPTCDNFNGSDHSVMDCPESTMCVKRVTTQDIGPDLSSRGVRRGCAPQTTRGMQKKVGRHWEPVNEIYEVYEEGCIDDPSNEHKLTKTVLCYCRGDLCNSSGKMSLLPASLLITLGTLLKFVLFT